MKTILTFHGNQRDYKIPFEKISVIAFKAGKCEILTTGDEHPIVVEDSFTGELTAALAKQLSHYYDDKKAHWMEAIQYGVIMACNQGIISVTGRIE